MTKKRKNKKFQQNNLTWFKQHKLASAALVLIIIFGGIFSYNKYLDWQNVQDMKQLLADFEQLERDIEASSGEELYIEADCGNVGKFATSYACHLYLKNSKNQLYQYRQFSAKRSSLTKSTNRCRVIDGKDATYLNFYSCTSPVRGANEKKSEQIFVEYDTSPNSPF